MAAHGFEQVQHAHHVRFVVELRVQQAVAYAGLSRQVDDRSDRLGREGFLEARRLAQVVAVEYESRMGQQEGQAVFFKPDIVVIVEVVEAHNAMAQLKQPTSHPRTHKARGSSN